MGIKLGGGGEEGGGGGAACMPSRQASDRATAQVNWNIKLQNGVWNKGIRVFTQYNLFYITSSIQLVMSKRLNQFMIDVTIKVMSNVKIVMSELLLLHNTAASLLTVDECPSTLF